MGHSCANTTVLHSRRHGSFGFSAEGNFPTNMAFVDFVMRASMCRKGGLVYIGNVSYLHHTAAYIILSTVQCGVQRRGVPPGARHAAVVTQGAQKEK